MANGDGCVLTTTSTTPLGNSSGGMNEDGFRNDLLLRHMHSSFGNRHQSHPLIPGACLSREAQFWSREDVMPAAGTSQIASFGPRCLAESWDAILIQREWCASCWDVTNRNLLIPGAWLSRETQFWSRENDMPASGTSQIASFSSQVLDWIYSQDMLSIGIYSYIAIDRFVMQRYIDVCHTFFS